MTAIRFQLLLWSAVLPVFASAAGAPFHFDRPQTIELATALIRSEFEKHPQAALPGVDIDHPLVVAVRDGAQRRFVFVSFASTLAQWGEYVIFELCGTPTRMVVNRAGRVIDVGFFREAVSKLGPTTKLGLPDVCGTG
jgi:hypothetical protein